MIFTNRAIGCLVVILFVMPLMIIAASFVDDMGAITIFIVGRLANRNMIEDVIYEKSGPVKLFLPRFTLLWIRVEYWGPILLIIYFAYVTLRYYR